jgi:hypothetical protein
MWYHNFFLTKMSNDTESLDDLYYNDKGSGIESSKILKHLWFSWKNQWFSGWLFDLFNCLRTMVIYQYQVFDFLRTMCMNPKNRPDNWQGFLFFNNHPSTENYSPFEVAY